MAVLFNSHALFLATYFWMMAFPITSVFILFWTDLKLLDFGFKESPSLLHWGGTVLFSLIYLSAGFPFIYFLSTVFVDHLLTCSNALYYSCNILDNVNHCLSWSSFLLISIFFPLTANSQPKPAVFLTICCLKTQLQPPENSGSCISVSHLFLTGRRLTAVS